MKTHFVMIRNFASSLTNIFARSLKKQILFNVMTQVKLLTAKYVDFG